MRNTTETVTGSLLAALGLSVSQNLLKDRIITHPEYPSLLSITDTLDYLGISNTAIEIGPDQLDQVPAPYIVHLNRNGGEFYLVKNTRTIEEEVPEFKKNWSGVVLVAERQEHWKHSENSDWLRKDTRIKTLQYLSGAVFFILLVTVFVFFTNGQTALTGIIAACGMFISWLITTQELGIENKMASQVCGSNAQGCNKVIRSEKFSLPLGIKWGDIGMVWFSSVFLVAVLLSPFDNNTTLLTTLTLPAAGGVLFTFFSVFFQWKIAKHWCRLCLITAGLLWAQCIVLLPANPWLDFSLNWFSWKAVSGILSTLVLTGFIWTGIKHLLLNNRGKENDLVSLKRFKRNAEVFNALLLQQPEVNITPWEKDIQLGNASAPLQLMVACNPYCGPCAAAHEILHQLIEKNNEIGLTIRFAINTTAAEDKKVKAVNHILQHLEEATAKMPPAESVAYKRNVMAKWYQLMSMAEFEKTYPVHNKQIAEDMLQLHLSWSQVSKIAYTPSLFINGRLLPKQYAIHDLPGLVNSLQSGPESSNTPDTGIKLNTLAA